MAAALRGGAGGGDAGRASRSSTTTARFLGLALAFAIDREGRELELGYTVTPAARGRGAATWAVRALTEWAVRELDPLRIQLQISADNAASKRVAERAGYVYEGTLRSVHFKQGTRQDMEVWSRLPDDPAPTG